MKGNAPDGTTTTTTYMIVSEDVLFWMDQDLRDPARRAAAWRRPCPCRVAHAARRMHTCSAHALYVGMYVISERESPLAFLLPEFGNA